MATVSAIAYSPVKGLALAFHDEVELEQNGVRDNRRFHLIGADGRLVNGKVAGSLVQVAAATDRDGSVLSLRFPDDSVLEEEVVLGQAVETNFFGDRPTVGSSSEGSRRRSPVSPVAPFGSCAPTSRAPAPTVVSKEASPSSRLSRSNGLRRRHESSGSTAVVSGCSSRSRASAPIEEDSWLGRSVAIGQAVVRVHEVVGRCAVTTHDPDTGVPDLDTLRILAGYRPPESGEALPLGVWGSVERPGVVRLGDRVEPE